MKKRDILSLAILGVGAGLLLGACQGGNQKPNPNTAAAESTRPSMDTFYNSLSLDAQKKFDQLDPQHQSMAVEMFQSTCSGPNECKGKEGERNAANKAVETQYNNQMKQRSQNGGKVSTTATSTTTAIPQ